jgi:hypothetical protein
VTGGDLRHGWWTGSIWAFETLDGNSGAGGRVNANVGQYAAVMLYGPGPHVWYYDDDAGTLRHAWWNGAQWGFEVLDGLGGPGGRVNESVGSDATVMPFAGAPHVFYYDVDANDLRHGWWNGASWSFETLDGNSLLGGRVNADVGMYESGMLLGGLPHVFYRDEAGKDLRHAWWNGAQWGFETLDGNSSGPAGRINGDVGLDSAVTILGPQPQVFYYDSGSGDLRHGWYA